MQESVTLPPLGVVLALRSALARGTSAHTGPRGEKWRARRRGARVTARSRNLVSWPGLRPEWGQQAANAAGAAHGEAVRGLQEGADDGNRTVSVLCCLSACGKAEGPLGRERNLAIRLQ